MRKRKISKTETDVTMGDIATESVHHSSEVEVLSRPNGVHLVVRIVLPWKVARKLARGLYEAVQISVAQRKRQVKD